MLILAGKKTLVLDEIQRCPQLANWLISKHENSNSKLSVVLCGTPALGFKHSVIFNDNLRRISARLVLEPLSVLETLKLFQLRIPTHTTLDFIKLWTLTGGICRLVRNVLENVATFDNNQLFAWMKTASSELRTGMSNAEFTLLSLLCPKKYQHVDTVDVETARNLERRGALKRVDNDLAYNARTVCDYYVIDNAHLVSLLSIDLNSSGNNKTEAAQINKISGIGFEDCLFKLFSDILLNDNGIVRIDEKLSLVLDGFEMVGYKPILIAFGDYDVDGLLAQYKSVEYGKNDDDSACFVNRLVVFSLKLNGKLLTVKETAAKFIKENVLNIVKRLPFLIELTIVACCPEFTDDSSKQHTIDAWNSALQDHHNLFKKESLKESFKAKPLFNSNCIRQVCQDEFFGTDIIVNIKAISMEEILNAAKTTVDAIDVSSTTESGWPMISRKCFRTGKFPQLFGLKSSIGLLSGYRGVGKTNALKSFVPDGIYMEFWE
jgi:hypothetical protein